VSDLADEHAPAGAADWIRDAVFTTSPIAV
jgi:hypothetical protein